MTIKRGFGGKSVKKTKKWRWPVIKIPNHCSKVSGEGFWGKENINMRDKLRWNIYYIYDKYPQNKNKQQNKTNHLTEKWVENRDKQITEESESYYPVWMSEWGISIFRLSIH